MPVVVVTDYVTALPDQITRFVGPPFTATSSSGYGCSDTRDARRAHFSTDTAWISFAAVALLADTALVAPEIARQALADTACTTERIHRGAGSPRAHQLVA